jgi:oligopeptide transport system substrate-binding protein
MRWITVGLLVVFLLVSLRVGGAPATAAQNQTAGEKVLRIEYNSWPDTLDPQLTYDISQDMVVGLGFEGLTRIDSEMQTVPAAAESWEFSPDGLTLTFHLRDDLTYSDGSPLTAERFRYAITRTCDPNLGSQNASFFFIIVGCEAWFTSLDEEGEADISDDAATEAAVGVRTLDDQTLEIELTRPAVYFPTLASMSMFFPAKQELIEAGGEEWWRDSANLIGNGPFQIVSLGNDTDVPSKMELVANERYWGGRPKLDRIEYVMANEPRTAEERFAAYKRGELDMVWMAADASAAVEADPELSRDLLQTPRAATIELAFNVEKEPFTDQKVREAFAHGFDREAYCRQVWHGYCLPTHSWIAPGTPGYVETDAFAFDPEKARQALAESSYGGPESLPEVIWYYSADPDAEGITSRQGAEWLAAQYRAVLGIELKLEALEDDEWDPLYESPESLPQWSDWGWFQAYPDPQYWLSEVWTCNSNVFMHRGNYCNPELDALLARADGEQDAEERIALYQEAERMLIADAPAIFLHNWTEAVLVKPYVTGYAVTPIDHWPGWTTPLTIDVERTE